MGPGQVLAVADGDVADLAAVLSRVALALSDESGMEETLAAATASSVDTVPGADYAGVSLVEDRQHVRSLAATNELVARTDKTQEELGEGPCLDAIWDEKLVRVDDMQREERWPAFAPRALELGVRSMLAFQLFTDGRYLGALNLYSCEAHGFSDESEHTGLLFASHTAIALRGAQQEMHLNEAIANRDLIGQAKGILMERYRISADQAFRLLVSSSQQEHVKLRQIAHLLVRTVSERESPPKTPSV